VLLFEQNLFFKEEIMKKIIFTFFLFTGLSFAQGEWELLQPDLPFVLMFDIIFTDSQTGYFLGTTDLVKTADEGDNWEVLNTPASYPYKSFYFRNNTGWLGTGQGKLFKSIDGGNNWNEIYSSPGNFTKIYFYDDLKGWAIVDNNHIFETNDGGVSWDQQFAGSNDSLYSFFFIDSLTGWCGRNLKTTDGGESWQIIQTNLSSSPLEINFLNSNLGFCRIMVQFSPGGYYYPQLFRTSNGGLNWTWVDLGFDQEENWVKKIMPIDTNFIYVTASLYELDRFKKSTDGGNTWTTVFDASEYFRVYTSILTPDTTIFYTEDWPFKKFIFRRRAAEDNFYMSNRTDGTSFWDILPLNNDTVIAAGESGKIYKTTNHGLTWDRKSSPETGLIRKLLLKNNEIWAAGSIIMKSTDLGENWEIVYSNPDFTFNDICFPNDQIGVASCPDGFIVRTTDGGSTWNQMQLGNDNMYKIFFYRATGWIAAYNSNGYRTTDYGSNWTQIPYIPYDVFYFKNEQEGCAGVMHTYDGGNSWVWTGWPYFPGGYFRATTFLNDTGYVLLDYPDYYAYDSGSIWKSEDFGITWDTVFAWLDNRYLSSIRMLDSRHGWICGQYGTIMYYDDTTYIPVELNSLTAKILSDKVSLNWTTATETNNRGFDVERLSESLTKKWEKIGFVEGNGTTTQAHQYSYIDNNVPNGKYSYRLKQIDFDGSYKYSKEVEVEINPKLEFSLEQNYPNPFNPVTTIKYSVPMDGNVKLTVYNILGQQVAELLNGEVKAGNYEIKYDGKDLTSGVYFYRIKAMDFVQTKKMLLVK
jgi:photosystem II stability/assembly factor-like uncharacterized protein